MKTFDVLIVGAGIVGCAIARECAAAGLRVGLIEADMPGAGATGAAMGHVVTMADSLAQFALTIYSRSLWQAERARLPDSVQFEERGTLWIAADDDEMAEVETKGRVYRDAGLEVELVTPAALAGLEPNLRAGLAGAMFVPGDRVVYPPAAVAFYLEEAKRLGAELISARALRAGDGTVGLADGTQLAGRSIVLAVGVACDLLPSLPIETRKGHLLLTDRNPDFVRHQIVELGYLKSAHATSTDSVAFNVQPRQTGEVLIGSSRQYGTSDPAVEEDMLRRILDRAEEFLPTIKQLSIGSTWTGFRAATQDKLPFLGPAKGLSDDPSLWLAVGFEGLGITSAPGAARLLVDSLLGHTAGIDVQPYLAERMQHSKLL